MPRSSAAAAEMHEHAVAGEPMAPPAGLSAEEARDWAVLADAGRLGCDQAPLLTQLVRAMARSRRIAVELAALGERSLAGSTKAGREARAAYLQIARTTGIDPALMHRIAVIGSGTLDSLPHNGAVVTLLAVCGTTHRESYLDIVMVGIVGAMIALAVLIGLGSAFGSF